MHDEDEAIHKFLHRQKATRCWLQEVKCRRCDV